MENFSMFFSWSVSVSMWWEPNNEWCNVLSCVYYMEHQDKILSGAYYVKHQNKSLPCLGVGHIQSDLEKNINKWTKCALSCDIGWPWKNKTCPGKKQFNSNELGSNMRPHLYFRGYYWILYIYFQCTAMHAGDSM